MTFNPMTGLLVFVAYFVLDAAYAAYTIALTKHQPHRAALLAILIYACTAYGVRNYVNDAIYLIPLVLGAWSGTFVTVSWMRRRAGTP